MKKILLSISALGVLSATYFFLSFSGGITENSAYHYAMQVNGKSSQISSTAQSCNICHGGSTAAPDLANEGGLIFDFAMNSTTYTAGQDHLFKIEIEEDSGDKHGYELIALDSMMNGVGSFTHPNDSVGTGSYTVDGDVKMYPFSKHRMAFDSRLIVTTWTAPTSYDGEVTFYAIAVSANGNSQATGDNVYYDKFKVTKNNISIKEYEANKFFNIYSENGIVHFKTDLELKDATIEVYDVLGKVSVSKKTSSNQFTLNTNQTNGIVFVRIKNGDNIYTSKLKL